MSTIKHLRLLAAAVLATSALAGLSACGSGSATNSGNAKINRKVSATTPSPPRFSATSGIAVDPQGYVYVTDYQTGQLLKLGPDGRYVKTVRKFVAVGGNTSCGPSSVALGARGALYLYDGCAASIDALTPSGRIVHRYPCPGGSGVPNGGCENIALDHTGHVYIPTAPGAIERYTLSTGRGTVFRRFAQAGPDGIATDPQGHVYVGLVHDDRVVELSASGRELAHSAQFGRGPTLNEVDIVAVDPHGSVYAQTGVDQQDLTVIKLSPKLKRLQTIASLGKLPGQVEHLWGMTVDRHGNLYLGDNGNHRIEKFSPAGKVLAIWR